MSNFIRKAKELPKKVYKKPWDDPNYDALRADKTVPPPETEEQAFGATCHIARAMLKRFGRKKWMWYFIDENEENKPFYDGIMKGVGI